MIASILLKKNYTTFLWSESQISIEQKDVKDNDPREVAQNIFISCSF